MTLDQPYATAAEASIALPKTRERAEAAFESAGPVSARQNQAARAWERRLHAVSTGKTAFPGIFAENDDKNWAVVADDMLPRWRNRGILAIGVFRYGDND